LVERNKLNCARSMLLIRGSWYLVFPKVLKLFTHSKQIDISHQIGSINAVHK